MSARLYRSRTAGSGFPNRTIVPMTTSPVSSHTSMTRRNGCHDPIAPASRPGCHPPSAMHGDGWPSPHCGSDHHGAPPLAGDRVDGPHWEPPVAVRGILAAIRPSRPTSRGGQPLPRHSEGGHQRLLPGDSPIPPCVGLPMAGKGQWGGCRGLHAHGDPCQVGKHAHPPEESCVSPAAAVQIPDYSQGAFVDPLRPGSQAPRTTGPLLQSPGPIQGPA